MLHDIEILVSILAAIVAVTLIGIYAFEDRVGRSLSGEVAYLGDELVEPVIRAVEAAASTPSAAVPVPAAAPVAGSGSPVAEAASDPATLAPAASNADTPAA
jgi:hypothetical protein